MTLGKLWVLTVFLLIGSFVAGRFAIFTNGGNGNIEWYLLLWLVCTSLFCVSGLLFAKVLNLKDVATGLIVLFLGLLGSISSSPIGLMGILGLPVLIPFSALVVVLLMVAGAKLLLSQSPPKD